MTFTLGGLHTRTSGEVLDMEERTIPGLFAAGRSTSCLSAQNCFTSGIQLGEGPFFGRQAGRSAGLRAKARNGISGLGVNGGKPAATAPVGSEEAR